jgi:7-cyano-7-deazaguanine synthase in queuosine biosynthesis
MSEQMDSRIAPELSGYVHSARFTEALRDNSNLAMDWLWLASQLDDALERQYCVKRAHYIDPDSVAVCQPGFLAKLKNAVHHALKRHVRSKPVTQAEQQLVTDC